jgi:hypothetical protein
MNACPTFTDYIQRPPHPAALSGGTRTRGETKVSGPDAPLISVVTAVLNRKNSLQRTIDSVAGQNYPNLEHVIVDGGSTDGTLDIIRANDARIAYWNSEPDHGIYDAMNRGLASSRGDYISILNSDDYYRPGAIEAVAKTIVAMHCDVAYGDYTFVVADIGMQKPIVTDLDLKKGMTIGHAIFVARHVYERLGLYDTRYRYSADLDFALRMKNGGVKFAKVGGAPLQYFSSGGAAETHLVSASLEAAGAIRRQAGSVSAVIYGIKGLKRVVLRGIQNLNRSVFGEHSYLRAKERYYASMGYQKET